MCVIYMLWTWGEGGRGASNSLIWRKTNTQLFRKGLIQKELIIVNQIDSSVFNKISDLFILLLVFVLFLFLFFYSTVHDTAQF
jgi:hypothetical protein